MTDSVAVNNVGAGFQVLALAGTAPASLMLVRSLAANNGVGLEARYPNATLRFAQSTITGNTVSWRAQNSAVLRSYGNNSIDGNADGDPAPSLIAYK